MTIKGGKGENPGDNELIGICSIFMCMHVCYMDYHIKVGFFNINTHLTRLGCAFKLKRAKYIKNMTRIQCFKK